MGFYMPSFFSYRMLFLNPTTYGAIINLILSSGWPDKYSCVTTMLGIQNTMPCLCCWLFLLTFTSSLYHVFLWVACFCRSSFFFFYSCFFLSVTWHTVPDWEWLQSVFSETVNSEEAKGKAFYAASHLWLPILILLSCSSANMSRPLKKC